MSTTCWASTKTSRLEHTTTAKMLLGQRLYRTPVDDRTRERWLRREHGLTMTTYGVLLLIALVRLI